MTFAHPVSHVYNPLVYARAAWESYLQLAANEACQVMMLGMNPGPWGMAQTGVPFGEIQAVRDWMGIDEKVASPANTHPKRPIQGFDCPRSEVSGRRLWGLMKERFPDARVFFARNFVANYCPLVFMADSGRNVTPDKLPAAEREPLFAACDNHLRGVIEILRPRYLVGVGKFAETRIHNVVGGSTDNYVIGSILHPSPASPAANRDWAGTATKQLEALGIW